jgi:Protein of unknown function (DUF4199)
MPRKIINSAMRNGLILGVLFSINFLFSISKNSVFLLLTYAIAVYIVVIMYRMSVRHRDNECEGVISYGKAFLFVLLTFFYAALISTVVKFIYFQFINTAYLDNVFQESVKMMEMIKYKLDDEAINQLEGMMKPASYSFVGIWVNLFFGTIVGLIMAAFVKKEKSIFEEKSEKE